MWSLGITCVELGKILSCVQASHSMKKYIEFTVDFTLLYCAALPSSLGNWVLRYEVANYVAS